MGDIEEMQQRSWVWMRDSSLQDFQCVLIIYYKNILEDVHWVLNFIEEDSGVDVLGDFRRCPFGHMLDYVGGNSNNTTIHTLMSREVIMDGASEFECGFRIGETNIRFSPVEFALVIGIRFGGSDFDLTAPHEISEDSFYHRVLGGEPTRLGELFARFMSFDLGLRVDDYVKVAKVLVLYNMFIGYDQPHNIDSWIWSLVEDDDRFDSFPWEAYSYRVLMHYMTVIPKTAEGLASRKKKSYHFYGPIWVLQVWAYEAIRPLGELCGKVTSPLAVPRCLRWTFPRKAVSFGDIFKREVDCLVVLETNNSEIGMTHYLSTQSADVLAVQYTVTRNRVVRPTYQTVAGESRSDRASNPSRPS